MVRSPPSLGRRDWRLRREVGAAVTFSTSRTTRPSFSAQAVKIYSGRLLVECAGHDPLEALSVAAHHVDGHLRGRPDGIPIRPRRDRREPATMDVALVERELERTHVGGAKQWLLAVRTATPHMPDRVDDLTCLQPASRSDYRVSRPTVRERYRRAHELEIDRAI